MSSHGGTQNFWGPDVGALLRQSNIRHARSQCRTKNGSDIAGILDTVKINPIFVFFDVPIFRNTDLTNNPGTGVHQEKSSCRFGKTAEPQESLTTDIFVRFQRFQNSSPPLLLKILCGQARNAKEVLGPNEFLRQEINLLFSPLSGAAPNSLQVLLKDWLRL